MDNNPKLNTEESTWLNVNVKTEHFNFEGKYVCFAEMTPGLYSIGKSVFPIKKKDLFIKVITGGCIYQVYTSDAEEKKKTNGYDAIVVITDIKYKRKFQKLTKEDAFRFIYNRYPQIPVDAGVDNNPVLNKPNADFFNELNKHGLFHSQFDFSGKKMALFERPGCEKKIERRSIAEYLERIKKCLDEYGHVLTDSIYFLTKEEKEASGGYDVIIQYQCKKGMDPRLLIEQLNKSNFN